MAQEFNTQQLYNTPIEIATRVLILLNELGEETKIDKDRILFLDHLAIHTEDVGGGKSLHPPVPNRSIQAFAKSALVQKGLSILVSKELAYVEASAEGGFFYYASDLSGKFLAHFQSDYFHELKGNINWVVSEFGDHSSEELKKIMLGHIGLEY
jgi:hypothetical protein